MNGPVQSEPNHKYSPVHDEPDLVRGSTVTPPALNLLEPEYFICNTVYSSTLPNHDSPKIGYSDMTYNTLPAFWMTHIRGIFCS